MSLSIHIAGRNLEEARRRHQPDTGTASESRLRRKRRIRALVQVERDATVLPRDTAVSTPVTIRQTVAAEFVHFPADASALEGLFEYLPAGVLDGLEKISLELRAGHETHWPNSLNRDPWLATPSQELFGGIFGRRDTRSVYVGEIPGAYFPATASIALYAYLCDPANPGLQDWGILLRLYAMNTFLQELAHHFDHRHHGGRVAEQRAYDWTVECAVPYLERAYPHEREALRQWVRHYGGVDMPLDAFVAKPRPITRLFSARSAVEALIEEIRGRHSLTECRLAFAEHLHFGEFYEQALESIGAVLDEDPNQIEALTLQADIFVHQERYEEAVAIAETALREEGVTNRICGVLMEACEALKDWPRVIDLANLLLELPADDEWDRLRALRHRAQAYLGINRVNEARLDIEALEASREGSRRYRRDIQRLGRALSAI